MRLLKTKLISEPGALEIEEFDDTSTPKYAILSHRWGNDELTLQDVERNTTAKEGFKKVQQSCDMAKRNGIDYIWIDTCCINKESSSELSEAINSMYLWYFKAHICYAYLADVPSTPFEESQWFTRGWTLQELLAPADLVFFDANWKSLGTKEGLQREISSCTGIPVDILSGDDDLETCSIAQRMSWAAKRSTKRVEDLAYCLLGIFGINMPLLYGEGERAFIRLQEEIMRVSDDHSLFAWESPDNRGGLLATSPAAFKGSGNIIQVSHVDDSHNALTRSSRGVHLDIRLIGMGAQKLGLALLLCKERDGSNNQIAIYLTDLTGTMETFQRVRSEELKRLDLVKTRSSQYLTRRACVQTGRLIPTRRPTREIDAMRTYEPYDDVVLEFLINRLQPEALLHAAQQGDQDDVWLMLTRRDIDINLRNRSAWPALFLAISCGHEVVVKMLLAQGADTNLEIGDGYTPLILAIEKGHKNIVKLLLERIAANIDTKDNMGQTSLLLAIEERSIGIVELLLEKGADIEAKGNKGRTPLLRAVAIGYPMEDGIKLLLEAGANTEAHNDGWTPLLLALEAKTVRIANLLLEKGANIEAKDNEGRTPLLRATTIYENSEAIKLLLQYGADIEAKDNEGRTPLSWVIIVYQNSEVIRLLLKYGANIKAKDNEGRTPLSWATIKHRNMDIHHLLGDNGKTAKS
ncbi:HET protein [Trichoderma atroviride IMI 206040]|uniref:HET protein n=1 Tax=Hypocrea atroviridis (strain ATCC 20476 / IMI 206040) TaxID=452589 RepID=G9NV52_HYPAI|nr:HET protein [Trichoderma atroviride IMI 206040]EHK44874.1 HET protein [Trichoderma atroviride IMI 206040]